MKRQQPASQPAADSRLARQHAGGATAEQTGIASQSFQALGAAARILAGRHVRGSAGDPPGEGPHGEILGIEDDAIVGWAWRPARPDEPLDVEIYAGSLKVGHARADLFDLKLAKANIGNGLHRFAARLDRLPPGSPPFQLRVVVADSEVELQPSIALATIEDAERFLSGSEYLGRVTDLANGMIRGWAVNRRNPQENPVLFLRDGDRVVLSQPARERISVAIESGVMASVYGFELPLPATLLDGKLHQLFVSAGPGGRSLEGSPIMFGPSDVASLARSLISALDRIRQLELRVETLQASGDLAHFEKQLTTKILDPVDMLLNVHRDAIERELAVMRRQLTHVLHHVPEGEPEVIVPLSDNPQIDDETVPPISAFAVAGRVAPLLDFDLAAQPMIVRPSAGLKWSGPASTPGILIAGSGRLEIDETVAAPASLMLLGHGANDAFGFCGIMTALDGFALSGRVDVFDSSGWCFIGTTINMAVAHLPRGLAVEFLPGFSPPSKPLTLERISVFGPGRLPPHTDGHGAIANIVHLGTDRIGSGWHAVEAGRSGGICWMGERSETMFQLRSARLYRFLIPEVRPLTPDILRNIQISIGGSPAQFKVTPIAHDSTTFSIAGECRVSTPTEDALAFVITFPRGSVRTPKELGLNDDERSLTIAVRAIALRIVE